MQVKPKYTKSPMKAAADQSASKNKVNKINEIIQKKEDSMENMDQLKKFRMPDRMDVMSDENRRPANQEAITGLSVLKH